MPRGGRWGLQLVLADSWICNANKTEKQEGKLKYNEKILFYYMIKDNIIKKKLIITL